MQLLTSLFKQLKDTHLAAVNNLEDNITLIEEQITDSASTLNSIRSECFRLAQTGTTTLLIKNYYEVAELMAMEIYAHNSIRIRKLCS